MELDEILRHFDLPGGISGSEQLRRKEDGEPYRVWKLGCGGGTFILKEAKGCEAEVYRRLLPGLDGVPRLFQSADAGGCSYLLMEFVEGDDLCRCSRGKLRLAMDALISMQRQTWNSSGLAGFGYTFEASLKDRRHRGEYLNDAALEAAYARFLDAYAAVPRTLCHNDLLPFNVLVPGDRAVLIDWEYAGILPYPASFARLIAHGEEDDGALFYLTREDRDFAAGYYYDRLLRDMGVGPGDWRRTLELFLFYEYCEWVFIGNKYKGANEAYYRKYLALAKRQAEKLLAEF